MDTIFPAFVLAADAPAPAPAPSTAPSTTTAPAGQGQASPTSGLLDMLPLFAIIFFIFYFLVIRPQSKERKKREELLKAAKKGDKIVTTAGIHGKIVSNDDLTYLVEVDDGVRLRFDKAAIWQVRTRDGEPAAEAVAPDSGKKS